jgi:hypothetical protein
VDVGLSLLSHTSMQLKFWDEAYLTVVFLINRTPSCVIGYQSPMQCLLGQIIPFFAHLDVHVDQTCDRIALISSHFNPHVVFSWATTISIRDTSVLSHPQVGWSFAHIGELSVPSPSQDQ